MSIGKINKIIDYTKKILEKTNKCKSENAYYDLLKETYYLVREKYPETTLVLMNEIFTTLFTKEFTLKLTDNCNYFPGLKGMLIIV